MERMRSVGTQRFRQASSMFVAMLRAAQPKLAARLHFLVAGSFEHPPCLTARIEDEGRVVPLWEVMIADETILRRKKNSPTRMRMVPTNDAEFGISVLPFRM